MNNGPVTEGRAREQQTLRLGFDVFCLFLNLVVPTFLQSAVMVAKIAQAYQANQHRRDNPEINVGDLVMLSTLNRKKEHSEKRVAKFMAQFDGPYQITNVRSDQLKLNAPANAAFYFYLFAKE